MVVTSIRMPWPFDSPEAFLRSRRRAAYPGDRKQKAYFGSTRQFALMASVERQQAEELPSWSV